MKNSINEATKTDTEIAKLYAGYIPEFVIEGLIKKFGKNIIAAERGTGKTRLLLFIAYAIIYECEEILGYRINSFGNVLFFNLELSEKEFKAFTEPIRKYFENELGLKRKHELYITSYRDCQSKINEIKLMVQIYQPIITIIDNYKLYSNIICGEEKEREITNANIRKVLSLLDDLINEFNTTVVLINHTNKGTNQNQSNADLMYGPGALADFADHVTLIRKTKYSNQRLIVPDKSRFCSEGYNTTNLVEIKSADPSSAFPDFLYFELIDKDVDEIDYLPAKNSRCIPEKLKQEIYEEHLKGELNLEQLAEKFLGNKSKKGTIYKICQKLAQNKEN
ncbi:MAG: AAA family ATPase [Chitinophagales bacterium]|nr:AAA family ATPase [Chitinophagales bacterium]